MLYPALEDFKLDVVIGKGPSARSIRLDLPRFTLVGGHHPSRAGSRFRCASGSASRPRLDYYAAEDLARVVTRSAGHPRRARSTPDGADGDRRPLARDAAGRQPAAPPRPRLRRGPRTTARSPATSRGRASTLFEVDEQGLDKLDLAILSTVVEKFGGGPVGLSTLAAAVGEETDTVEDVYEPYLLQLGFLKRTPRGRVATERAYRHLGVTADGVLPLA